MQSAIVINFDYENSDYGTLRGLYRDVRGALLEAGFRQEERMFISNMGADEACEVARGIVEGLEVHHEFFKKEIFKYIKEFYGFEMDNVMNMMVPGGSGIQVDEAESEIEELVFSGYSVA